MARAWKITYKGGYNNIRYEHPSQADMLHYQKHNAKVEEVEVKGPIVRLFYALTDGGDGSHGVRFFPSQEEVDKVFDDEGFEIGDTSGIPAEIDSAYINLSEYEVWL